MYQQPSHYQAPLGYQWHEPMQHKGNQPWQNNWHYHHHWNDNNWNNTWDNNWDNYWNYSNWHHNYWDGNNWSNHWYPSNGSIELTDYGSSPFVVNIEEATKQNETFRTALWTGEYLQLTLMSIEPGDDIGLEIHEDHDQFIRIEEGEGIVQMGDSRDRLDFQERVHDDYVIVIPAGKWHNLTNTGNRSLKLYSIYAPPEHPFGTVHETKEIAMGAEANHDN